MTNGKPTNNNKEDPQDKHPPIDDTGSERLKKNKITAEKANRKGNKYSQEQWPGRVMALASLFLVVVTILYTYYAKQQARLTGEGLGVTREALAENTRQFSATLQEMKEQTVAAQIASDAAEKAAAAASISTESASRQVVVMKEQTNAAIDAMRLDQRAWLGYHRYVVQAREGLTSKWEGREPKAGEQFRVRFFIHNVGKTPALNVRPMVIKPMIIPIGVIPNEPEEWPVSSVRSVRSVIFPNDDGLSHNTRPLTMSDQQFSAYSSTTMEVFFWAKIYYCDITGRRHWTQTGVAHSFRSNDFSIRSSTVRPDPGEADHPDCQN